MIIESVEYAVLSLPPSMALLLDSPSNRLFSPPQIIDPLIADSLGLISLLFPPTIADQLAPNI